MIGEPNQTIYYLVYATKHPKGMGVMKNAMWKVYRRGTYRFSDITDPGQRYIIDYSRDEAWTQAAAKQIYGHFHGKTASCGEVDDFVTLETPHRFLKSVLQQMEASGRIVGVVGRRKINIFPDECKITFSA